MRAPTKAFLACTGLLTLAIVLCSSCGGGASTPPPPPPPPPPPANTGLQLKASPNHRYLVDQNGSPVLLAGDSPHAMFVNLNSTDLETYLSDRHARGFNILWVESLCSDYISNCRSDLSTYDRIKPFTSGTDQTNFDVTTPNPAYWSRVDSYVNAASSHGLIVLFDTWETGALMPLANANGNSKMRSFGAFLGNRYKNFPNIIWITGNDFQTWTNSTDNALMQNLMAGIASADTNHLQTTELDFYASGSLDNALLAQYTTLAGAYDYYCSYGETLSQYNQPGPVPVFFLEGYYEGDITTLGNTGNDDRTLRAQEWRAALAGATSGQMWGSQGIYSLNNGWQNFLNTNATAQFGLMNTFLRAMQWYNLVPDQNHTIVTAGYGTLDATENNNSCVNTNNYVTTSYLADGSASVSYTPFSANLTVDLSKFRNDVTARWYDPANGSYQTVSGSPFSKTGGSHVFSTPGSNSGGDSDWVLVLTAP